MRPRRLHSQADQPSGAAGEGADGPVSDGATESGQSTCSCVLDDDGNLVLISVAARAMLGLGHNYRSGMHWLDAWPAENHTLLDHALDRAQSGHPVEFSVFRSEPNAQARWIKVTMGPARNASDPRHKLHISLRDITAEKSAESQKYRFEM
ncbi:MAG: PAS domain-containing protein [Rhodobacteraceae bacterium]|nr:PAS domain-containing protein [Paracoccaceae bacterium]